MCGRATLHGLVSTRLEHGFTRLLSQTPESLYFILYGVAEAVHVGCVGSLSLFFRYPYIQILLHVLYNIVYYLLLLPRSPDSAAANLERKSSVLPTLSAGTTTPAAVVLGDGAMGMAASAAGAVGLCAPAV